MYNVRAVTLTPELKQKFLATECQPQSDYGDAYEVSFYQRASISSPLLITMAITYNPETHCLQLFYSLPRIIGSRLHYLGSLHIAPQAEVLNSCWDIPELKNNNPHFFDLFSTQYLRQIRNAAIADIINRY